MKETNCIKVHRSRCLVDDRSIELSGSIRVPVESGRINRILQAIREPSKIRIVPWVVVLVIALAVYSFVVGDDTVAGAGDYQATVVPPLQDMVLVGAGPFFMGSTREDIALFAESCPAEEEDPNCGSWYFDDELPQQSISLPSYYVDKFEVTNSAFSVFVQRTGHLTTAEKRGSSLVWNDQATNWIDRKGANWRHPAGTETGLEGLEDHPVVHMSWHDAQAYCQSLGKRLPTKEEWEKAARGTDGRKWPWGDKWDSSALNFYSIKPPGTRPVGRYPAGVSPYGAIDMLGNVLEWVNEGERRGGSWASIELYLHVAWRNYAPPEDTRATSGFRCAYSEPQK